MEQQAYLGKNSINELVPLLKKHNAKHVFLVRGKDSYTISGASSIITNALFETDCSFTEFYDFSENPKYEDMRRGVEAMNKFQADIIIAVGGGSVLDMSKLIRFFCSYKGEVTSKYFVKTRNVIPLIALPTTAGTGAEATHFAVVYKDKIKYSVEHEDMLPDYAIIYPPFTYGNPKYLTACTGFDALAQAIEAFWSLNATSESDVYAEKAINLLWHNLPDVVNNPTYELRDKVLEGAYWAGRAINITKTTAPHAFSYSFTSHYGYPHGHAVALTFPFFIQLNCSNLNPDRGKVDKLLTLLSFENNTDVVSAMRQYIHLIGLTQSEQKYDRDLILASINLDRLNNNPVKVTNEHLLVEKLIESL